VLLLSRQRDGDERLGQRITHAVTGVCACAREKVGDVGGSGDDLGTNTGALTAWESFAEPLGVSGWGLPVLDHDPRQTPLTHMRMCEVLTLMQRVESPDASDYQDSVGRKGVNPS